jgi:hypothetical protein
LTVEGTFDIAKVCYSDLESSFGKSYPFNIPETSFRTDSFPTASSDYVTLNPQINSSPYLPNGYSCS